MIAYTIVTNSYLAYAKSLKESFLKYNQNDLFFIGLLDTLLENENLEDVVLVSDLGIDFLEEMHQKYNAFELSCAMKPFFAEYFFREKKADLLVYLDSDILVFNDFKYLEHLKNEYAIFLTPHIFNSQKNISIQKGVLASGIYNAGFFALSNKEESFLFLNWWKEKLKENCYHDVKIGLFVDQIWLNHVPLFFEKVFIITHKGYNVAYWNIEEREVNIENDILKVDKSENLVFFHFSGYELNNEKYLSKYGDLEVNFEKYPQTKPLFEKYNQNLRKYNHDFYKTLKSSFGTPHLDSTEVYLEKIKNDIEKRLQDEKERWTSEKAQEDQAKKLAEEQAYLAKKKKSYLSILWRALKGEIDIREN